MLIRALFAAVLHIATTLQAHYNNLIFSASVFKTIDAATEHGPQLIASVGRVVQRTPLKLSGPSNIPAIPANLSHTANVYPIEVVFVFDVAKHTTVTAAPTATATVSDNVCFLPTTAEILSPVFCKSLPSVLALSTGIVEAVVGAPPESAFGDLVPYDEEYARQQKRAAFTIWDNIDWNLIVSLARSPCRDWCSRRHRSRKFSRSVRCHHGSARKSRLCAYVFL